MQQQGDMIDEKHCLLLPIYRIRDYNTYVASKPERLRVIQVRSAHYRLQTFISIACP